MRAFYNEIDTYCCGWISNLMDAGLIMPGVVNDKDIRNLTAADVAGFERVHLFAGIAGWDFALSLAGWGGRLVWTGSCPCQPFSVAGNQNGFDDSRHLWPEFKRLIAQRSPPIVFGEQVAGAADWLRLVRRDLEEMDYAVGAIPMEAASANADHFRDRYWFVAYLQGKRVNGVNGAAEPTGRRGAENDGRLAMADDDGEQSGEGLQRGGKQRRASFHSQNSSGALADSDSQRSQIQVGESRNIRPECATAPGNRIRALVDRPCFGWGEGFSEPEFRSRGFAAAVASSKDGRWQYVECPDNKWRRLPPPGVRWLGTGIPSRVAKLRAIGNSIDPRPASKFIESAIEAMAKCAP